MIVVVDTNVLISGFINPFGSPGRIVELLVKRALQAAFDDRILLEYRSVSRRDKFGFDRDAVAEVLAFIESVGVRVLASPQAVKLPDPSDLPFVEVALAARATALITGNLKHFPLIAMQGVRVLSSPDFLAMYVESKVKPE